MGHCLCVEREIDMSTRPYCEVVSPLGNFSIEPEFVGFDPASR